MTSAATTLLDLQTADIDLMRARKRLEELPEKKAILEVRTKIKEIQTLQSKAAMLAHKLEAELKRRQDEIESLKVKVDAEQAKIMETTDHRQITALTREMDGLRRRMDKLDMESLQFMERIEKAADQLKTIDAHLEKLQEKDAQLVASYREAGGAVQREIADLEATRASLAGSLPADLSARYAASCESKAGVGVGKLENGACSACRMSLPAQQVQKLIDSGEDIGMCPECRRLIVIRWETAE